MYRIENAKKTFGEKFKYIGYYDYYGYYKYKVQVPSF